MGTRLYRKWTFSAAHKLASGARHECARLHGHTYEVEVCVIRVTSVSEGTRMRAVFDG